MKQKLLSKQVTIGAPTIAATVLGAVGAGLQVVNYEIPASSRLHTAVAVGILALASSGIPPLTGPAFKAALHLPPWASYLVNVALIAATIVLTTISATSSTHEWLAAVLTALASLGFSTQLPTTQAGKA